MASTSHLVEPGTPPTPRPRPSSSSLSTTSAPTPRHRRSALPPTLSPFSRSATSSPSSRSSILSLLILGTALRLALFSTPLPDILQHRIELSTPVSSFQALKETLHLSSLHVASPDSNPPPYSSSAASVSPLLLLLQPLLTSSNTDARGLGLRSPSMPRQAIGYPTSRSQPLSAAPLLSSLLAHLGISDPPSALLWTAFDLLAALALLSCSRSRSSISRATGGSQQGKGHAGASSPWFIMSEATLLALYLLNPIVVASCLARDLSCINAALIFWSTALALNGSILRLSLVMAVSSLVSLYPLLLVPALILLSYQSTARRLELRFARQRQARGRSSNGHAKSGGAAAGAGPSRPWASIRISMALLALAGGFGVSYTLAGNDWRFLDRVYGTILLLPNLRPNLGLWWYFFISMFDHFRSFFLLAFNLHPLLYVLPMLLRYGAAGGDALFAVTALCGVTAVFKSYPTLGDSTVWWTLLVGLHGEILPYLRYPFISLLLHLYALVLGPALHHLWLVAGSANANFFYAITLVWGLAGGSLLLDAMWAWGRHRWEVERPRIFIEDEGQSQKEGGGDAGGKTTEEGKRTRIVVQS